MKNINIVLHNLRGIRAHHFGNNRKPVALSRLLQILQADLTEPLKSIGGSPGLIGPSSEHYCPRFANNPGGFQDLLSGFYGTGAGNNGNPQSADLHRPHRDHGVFLFKLPACQFIGFGNGNNPLYPGENLHIPNIHGMDSHGPEDCLFLSDNLADLKPLLLKKGAEFPFVTVFYVSFENDYHVLNLGVFPKVVNIDIESPLNQRFSLSNNDHLGFHGF